MHTYLCKHAKNLKARLASPPKGNRVNIPEPGTESVPSRDSCGDANELGDGDRGPGKSSLFFIRDRLPGIGSTGDRDVVPVKQRGSCAVRSAVAAP